VTFRPEMLKFADQLAGSALGVQTVVEVGAEVGEAGLRVPEQVVGDGEDLVADGDQGTLLASSFDDPPLAGAQGKVVVLAAPMATSPMVAPIQGLALPVELGLVLPAEALVVGARLAHDTRCVALGKRPISMPISAMSSCAPVLPTPGISSSWVTWWANGASSSSIRPARLVDLGAERVDAAGHHL
jgi:hypothetical protein